MAKDKKNKDKKPPKLATGKSKKDKPVKDTHRSAADDAAEAMGPLLTLTAIGSIEGLPAKLNPISKALNAIKYAAYEAAGTESAPRVLRVIGRSILDLSPLGYEEYWDPPLTAMQLYIFLRDEESVAYVSSTQSTAFPILGPNVTSALNIIAKTLVSQSSSAP